MTVLVLVEVLSSLESTMIYAALPTIMRQYGNSALAGWLISGFVLIQASSSVIASKLGDLYGRRRLLVIVIAICTVGSLVSALATSLPGVIAGRALQGMSGALLPLSCGIIREVAPARRVPFLVGVVTAALSLAGGVGYILGGYLADTGVWQQIFWFTALYGLILLPLLALLPVGQRTAPTARIDIVGGTLFVPGVALILWVTTSGPAVMTSLGLGLIGAGVALLAAWLVWELRHPHPLVDVRLLRQRNVALGMIGSAFAGVSLMNISLVMMLILQQPAATGIGLGLTAVLAGVLKLPTNVTAFLGSTLSGWLGGRYTTRLPIILGGLVAGIAWAWLWLFNDTIWQVLIGGLLATLASGAMLAGLPNQVLQEVPVERSSEATGLSLLMRSVFSAVGAQVITAILAAHRVQTPGLATAYPSAEGYRMCFAVLCATGLALVATGLATTPRRVTPARPADTLPTIEPAAA